MSWSPGIVLRDTRLLKAPEVENKVPLPVPETRLESVVYVVVVPGGQARGRGCGARAEDVGERLRRRFLGQVVPEACVRVSERFSRGPFSKPRPEVIRGCDREWCDRRAGGCGRGAGEPCGGPSCPGGGFLGGPGGAVWEIGIADADPCSVDGPLHANLDCRGPVQCGCSRGVFRGYLESQPDALGADDFEGRTGAGELDQPT